MGKLRVGVIFGGRSGEHDVSLMSAAGIIDAIDKRRYEVVPIGIDRAGRWLVGGDPMRALLEGRPDLAGRARLLSVPPSASAPLMPDNPVAGSGAGSDSTTIAAPAAGDFASTAIPPTDRSIDIFFPVLHGPYGEDGTIQGLFELAGAPYVGAGVTASAVGMDKAFMKIVFERAGLPIVKHLVYDETQWEADPADAHSRIERELGYPCFVKPANLGSSVGISRVAVPQALEIAFNEAFRHDRKLVVERAAEQCREIEVSVLGNEDPHASIPGEIVPANQFYDYKAKYHDDRSELIIPARIGEATAAKVRRLAIDAFRAIDGTGLARVDFFVHKDTEAVWVNEINTMPGFTRTSMYPKLWEASGLPYAALIDRLIQLGLQRHGRRARRQSASIYDC